MYQLFLTKEASLELDRELAYSEEKWGSAHARRYAKELRAKFNTVRKNPKVYPAHDDLLPGIRIARHKGNQIIYTIDDINERIIILGVPSIYRELKPRSSK
jgi:plasmid stabilization system protein ParE